MANQSNKTKAETKTLEGALRAREGTHLAMSADVNYAGGEVRIVFGSVAGHERISLKVDGNDIRVEAK